MNRMQLKQLVESLTNWIKGISAENIEFQGKVYTKKQLVKYMIHDNGIYKYIMNHYNNYIVVEDNSEKFYITDARNLYRFANGRSLRYEHIVK